MTDRPADALSASGPDAPAPDARTLDSHPLNGTAPVGDEPFDSAESVSTMSLATLAPRSAPPAPTTAPSIAAAPAPAETATPTAPTPAPRLRAVPEGTEARGFVLYVGLDEAKAAAAGIDLGRLVLELKRLTGELAPGAETHAAVALAPAGAGGRDVDVVRLALQDPSALARYRRVDEAAVEKAPDGVVIDISRKRVLLDGDTAALTYKEFELLQYLVLREGRTIERAELIASLWADGAEGDDDVPNERTIDVHVRRLRAKLGGYEDIVRTVRGAGYRFDRHADVSIRYASTPSPDFF
jgi:DNA-binding winged helix-turn-helix (wHTH) protein